MIEIAIEVNLTRRTYEQVLVSLEQRGDLNLLIENLLIQHLDEVIPLPLNKATLTELYLEQNRYIHRLKVLEESIRLLDSLHIEQFEVNQQIRHTTLGLVVSQVRVQQAIAQLNQVIAQHPQPCSRPVFPHWLAAVLEDLESEAAVCSAAQALPEVFQ